MWAKQKSIQEGITEENLLLLKALELDIGVYLNEADFQDAFCGGQYGEPLGVKKWDPPELFITRP